MQRRYAAYLLRHWVLGDGRERVEVQQLPSGEARRYGSLAEAWSAFQASPGRTPGDTDSEPDPPAAAAGE
jgi:hypothetical protein